jgi:GntR family transcriptional regulator/MocR family aminotransferase
LAEAFARRRALDMRHSEIGTQAVMAEFIAAGHFQRHIRRMRIAARSRRDALLAGWPADVPGCAPLPVVEAGLHLCVRVNSLARERELISAAERVGVEITALSSYWLFGSTTPEDQRAGLVLGFAAVPEAQIGDALQALRRAWQS